MHWSKKLLPMNRIFSECLFFYSNNTLWCNILCADLVVCLIYYDKITPFSSSLVRSMTWQIILKTELCLSRTFATTYFLLAGVSLRVEILCTKLFHRRTEGYAWLMLSFHSCLKPGFHIIWNAPFTYKWESFHRHDS